MRLGLGLILCCLVLQGVSAQSPESEAVEAVSQDEAAGEDPKEVSKAGAGLQSDFGPAFERLVKLGLPDTRGASYVKLTLHGKGAEEVETARYSQMGGGDLGARLKTKGNAWLLPSTKANEADTSKGLSTLIFNGFEKVVVKPKKRRSSLARLLVGEEKPSKDDGDALLGGWKEQDVAADAKKILAAMNLKSKQGSVFDADTWSYSDTGAKWCARVLVMACQMYRAGHQDEANEITARLFQLAPEPIVVIDQVVNHLANTEYQSLVEAFFKSNNWKSYHAGTQQLVERFSRGWKSREGAELLLTHLDKRLKGVKPELKSLKGVTLKPEAVKIMDDWLGQTEPIIVNPPTCWLLGMDLTPSSAADAYSYGVAPQSNNTSDWVKKIGAMGMDGFIALTAAAADDSLIATTMSEGVRNYYGGYGMRYSSSSSGNISPAQSQYAAMTRPCSRGEIARKTILKTLPDAENELASLPAAELQSVAYQWWMKHRKDSPSALAKHFMESGNDSQRMMAVMALIQTNKESDAKIVEKYILGAEKVASQYSTVQVYLKARRAKGKSFFAAYSKALKDEVGEVADDDYENWQIKQAGGVDKYLKKLEVFVSDVSVEKVISEMKSGKTKVKDGMEMFGTVMDPGTFRKHLPTLVSIAREQKDPQDRLDLLESLYMLSYKEERYYSSQKKDDEYYASLPALFEKSKDDWSSMLAETATLPKSDSFGNASTQADVVAWVIEIIYFPKNQIIISQLQLLVGDEKIWPILVDHIQRVLKDGCDTDFPNPKNVEEPERKKIRKKLSNMKPLEIAKYYETLGLDQKLAWNEILDGYGDDEPAGVTEMKKMIVVISWANASSVPEPLRKKITNLTQYKMLDEKRVESILKLMLDDADQTASFALLIHSQGRRQLTLGVWGGKNWTQSKKYFLKSQLEEIHSGAVKKCAGVATMIRTEVGEAAMITVPEKNQKESKATIKQIVQDFHASIDDKKGANLLFFSETEENIKKQQEKEDQEDQDDADDDLLE